MGQRATKGRSASASLDDSTRSSSLDETFGYPPGEDGGRLVTHSAPQILQGPIPSDQDSTTTEEGDRTDEEREAALAFAKSPPRHPSPAMEMARKASNNAPSSLSFKIKHVPSKNPTRRLKPKAPSSYASSSVISGTSDSSAVRDGGTTAKEPVGVRDFIQLKLLGKGSHGKVVLVRHKATRKRYAMKILRKRDVIRRKQIDNSKTELIVHKLFASQSPVCPYITPLHWAFHTKSRMYMVFDYCSGGELYYHIGQRGKIPEVLARFYAAEIALALQHLHELNIVYRDLKPENLMLDADGHIYLVDFGLSKEHVTTPTTGSNTFCGTTEYLAPEILNYQEHGTGVDWWSFGMVLYEMLTGLPPWYSYNQEEVVRGILGGDLDYSSLQENARTLCQGLLERDPEKRFGAAEVMAHPFFRRVDWDKLREKRIASPFKPPQGSECCNFDPQFTKTVVEVERYPQRPPPTDIFQPWYFDRSDVVSSPEPAVPSGLKKTYTEDELDAQSKAMEAAAASRQAEDDLVESAKRALNI